MTGLVDCGLVAHHLLDKVSIIHHGVLSSSTIVDNSSSLPITFATIYTNKMCIIYTNSMRILERTTTLTW